MLVYIPKRCCLEGPGYLLGCIDVAHSFCCVTGLVPFSDNELRSFAPVNPLPYCTCGIIGTWAGDSGIALPVQSAVSHSCGVENLLLFWKRAGKLFIAWKPNSVHQQRSDGTDEYVIILYDSLQLSSSVVANENGHMDVVETMAHKHAISRAFYCHAQFCSRIEATNCVNSFVDFTCQETNIIAKISSKAYHIAVCFVSLIFTFCSTVCCFRLGTVTIVVSDAKDSASLLIECKLFETVVTDPICLCTIKKVLTHSLSNRPSK